MTAKFLRTAEFFNTPFLFLTQSDAEGFLAPSTVRNDLYIGAQICFDYDIAGLFSIQVKDADDDGLYSKADFRAGIASFLEDKRSSDFVVLNYFTALPDQLNIINRANDPFEKHESLTFIGAPIGTPIGSETSSGSLVFLARKTLAVYGNHPAHGTRIMVSSTKAKRTIILEDGSSTQVTLDGSFIAAALASLHASFSSPIQTVLLQTITSFDWMQTYTEEENAILGGNSLIYFKDESNGIYRIMEDVTVDPFSSDTQNLNQMAQKQFVTRSVRKHINNTIIGLVFPNAAAGVDAIQSQLIFKLTELVSRRFIGDYQDADGNVRQITAADTLVFRDPADPTRFNIGYNFFLATVAKRVFGLFTVNLPGGFPT